MASGVSIFFLKTINFRDDLRIIFLRIVVVHEGIVTEIILSGQ